ncbi:ABC transporter permease [Methylorubrum podarium]|jgi:sugar transport system permease protein|uniref:ABC transporter permease n=1 Tax=Methylorubrum podarium TaxID=200476 RepID=UPI001EE32948|nr:ABC transporter permease [Methylorubrum podarium]GJE69192.1 Ribose import permease protein RbsC [Methylorubrum podarium]
MTAATQTGKQARRGLRLGTLEMNEIGLLVILALLYAVFGATTNGFLSANNQISILRDGASIAIAAWAVTLIIIAGEIDVSVGPMVAFTSVCLAFLLQWHAPALIAILAALLVGAAFGTLAGMLRAYAGMPSFVATLGLWSALRGLAFFTTNALPVTFPDNDLLDSLSDQWFGIPASAVVMLILFGIFTFVSRKTAYGRSIFAIGGNASAAELCGIPVARIRVLLFTTSGVMSALAGVLLTARLGSGNAGTASGLEFDVIAAVVIGGTSLSGGRGSMLGSLLGVFVITLIGNGLVLRGINPFFQEVVRGVIIVLAVLANILVSRFRERRRGAR